ncbi:MAG: EamA family transporter, partial [Nitrososphaerota archaeon]|nr:EamA family transporter [Nitrososphaerota archaeon]
MSGVLLGVLLALSSAVFNGASRSFSSRPLTSVDARLVNYWSALVGLLASFLMMLASGQAAELLAMSPAELAIFLTVGVLNFGIGRFLVYTAIKNIGANQTGALLPAAIVSAFFFGVLFAGESLSAGIVVGAVLVMAGAATIEARIGASMRKGKTTTGIGSALAASALYGGTFVLLQAGLSLYPFAASAIFVSYISATAFTAVFYNPARSIGEARSLGRGTMISILLSSLLLMFSQASRFAALDFVSVVVAAPITQLNPVFIVAWTRVFARDVETFRARTLLGIAVAVVGAALVSY